MKVLSGCAVLLVLGALTARAGSVDLNTAGAYAVLGASTVTNTGSTVLNGDLGVYPGASITGFENVDGGPGIVNGATDIDDANAQQAGIDALGAYSFAKAESPAVVLTGTNLGGLTETPGVYFFASSAQLTGTLTLNALGNPNAQFIFQIGTTLTTATASSVVFTDGAQDDQLFWQVGKSATLGTDTTFQGTILADQSITLVTGSTIGCGRAIALNGAVTLDSNTIGGGCESSFSTPEPGTGALLSAAILLALVAFGVKTARSIRFVAFRT